MICCSFGLTGHYRSNPPPTALSRIPGPFHASTLRDAGYTADDAFPATNPTRLGYDFTGWYATKDGNGDGTGTPADIDTALSTLTFPAGTAPQGGYFYAGWTVHTGSQALYAYPNGRASSPTVCAKTSDAASQCTLDQALRLANEGDVIRLAADNDGNATFTTDSGWDVPKNSLTIEPDVGVTPILDGHGVAPYVLYFSDTGTLTVTGLTITGSVGTAGVSTAGGGIVNGGGGDLRVRGSTFSHNTVSASGENAVGGGVVNPGTGSVDVETSTFTGNSVTHSGSGFVQGGGILSLQGGAVAVRASTFVGNDSTNVDNAGMVVGGGVIGSGANGGTTTITASTFVGNTTTGQAFGGGIMAGNMTAVTAEASLFAGNSQSCMRGTNEAPITDAGYNISDDASCGFTEGTSEQSVGGLAGTLNALADNGGPTETVLPKAGSPAVGMIPASTTVTVGGSSVPLCPTTDQRGVGSAGGASCTAGSVQVTPPPACDAATFAADFNAATTGTVTLCGDLTLGTTDTPLDVAASANITLDLAGHSLTVVGPHGHAGIGVAPGTALTIEDTVGGGTLTATGGEGGAGIGGGMSSGGTGGDGGEISISGGTVTATGGSYEGGAGIGGGYGADGGDITITGGTVTAMGGTSQGGAGIGGGRSGAAGTITISGGTVKATGGDDSASIGSGENGAGGMIVIGNDSGAQVDVTANYGGGSGFALGGDTTFGAVRIKSGGHVTVNAPLRLKAPDLMTVDGTLTLAFTAAHGGANMTCGALTVNGTPINCGTFMGSGTIDGSATVQNLGAIRYTVKVGSGLTVLDHHYELRFDAVGGSTSWGGTPAWSVVDGPTLASVGRTGADLPGATRSGYTFTGWYLDPAATGSPVTATTEFTGSSSDGVAVPVTLHAGWKANGSTDPGTGDGSNPPADPPTSTTPPTGTTPPTNPVQPQQPPTDSGPQGPFTPENLPPVPSQDGPAYVVGGKVVVPVFGHGPAGVTVTFGGITISTGARDANGNLIPGSEGALPVLPGGMLGISTVGFGEGTWAFAWIYSEPTFLGSFKIGAGGNGTMQVPLPATLPPGKHTLVISGTNADGAQVTARIPAFAYDPATYVSPQPNSAAGNETTVEHLAATGVSPSLVPLGLAAIALIILGSALVWSRPRRRQRRV